MEKNKQHSDLISSSLEKAVRSAKGTNLYRRNLLKLLAVGGGAFVVGKLSGPVLDYFTGDKIISTRDFKDFKFIETTRELKLLDTQGEAIIIFDKDAIGS